MLTTTPRFIVKFVNGAHQVFDTVYYGGVQAYNAGKNGREAAESAADKLNQRHGGSNARRR